MTYKVGGLIEAADYNQLVFGLPQPSNNPDVDFVNYNTIIKNRNLMGFWLIQDGSKNLYDQTMNPLTGTVGLGASTTIKSTGLKAPAILFNTGNQNTSYAVISGSDTATKFKLTSATTSNFTIEAWIYPTPNIGGASSNYQMIVSKNTEYQVARMNDGRIVVGVNWGTTGITGLVDGQWIIPPQNTCVAPVNTKTHVAVTVSGTTLKIYLNGVQEYQTTITRKVVTSSNFLYIGARKNSVNTPAYTQLFYGEIADVRIWNCARTQSQISNSLNYTLGAKKTVVMDGVNVNAEVPTINGVLGEGYGDVGWGQPTLDYVAPGDTVTAAQWNSAIQAMNRMSSHLPELFATSGVGNLDAVAQYDVIKYNKGIESYNSIITSYIDTFYNNRLSAGSQEATTTTTATVPDMGYNPVAIFKFKVKFQHGNKARYFFNAGGQLKIEFQYPSGTNAADNAFSALGTNTGVLYISAPKTGYVYLNTNTLPKQTLTTYTGRKFTGVTLVTPNSQFVYTPTGKTVKTLRENHGYHAHTTTPTVILKRTAEDMSITKGTAYKDSHIEIYSSSNGTQGSLGDSGNELYFDIHWKKIGGALPITGAVITKLSVVYPSTAYLTNTWGTPTVTYTTTTTA